MTALLNYIRGVLSLIFLAVNTSFWGMIIFSVTLLRLLIPLKTWRKICGQIAIFMAENWVYCNNIGLILSRKIEFQIEGLEQLDRKSWYLVVSNHQSWVDIPVLQKVFYHQIPFLKFFLKKELIWVPLLGQAWWALDFPFMKRYSIDFIKKHPHLKGKDMEITRKACEKFKDNPVSIMNFTEGTRFTKEKHDRQKSPFTNLLKPKAGGIGFVLSAMGDQLSYILDVTIAYPDGVPDFWQYMCGNVKKVNIRIRKIPITEELLGDYAENKSHRVRFQKWLNDIWREKDLYLEHIEKGRLKN
ncbi:acyltransferase [bacterium]|nr:acyltransferase [bacterium]